MKKISTLLASCVAFAAIASPLFATPSWTTGTWTITDFAPSANNLIYKKKASITNAQKTPSGYARDIAVLTEGKVGALTTAGNALRYAVKETTTLTYTFAASEKGYDLNSVRFFTQQAANGTTRDRISVASIEVLDRDGNWSIVDNSSIVFEDPNSVGMNFAELAGTEGSPLGHGVTGMRITFGVQENTYCYYAEIEAIGVPVLAGPTFSVEQIGGDVDRALLELVVASQGSNATNADFYFAYGPDASSLGDYELVASDVASDDSFRIRPHGLAANTTYVYSIVASNDVGTASDPFLDTFSTFASPVSVKVTEIMASNGSTLLTADGDASDWFEIYNPNDFAVDLSGWFVCDDPTKKWSKWKELPVGAEIEAGGYMIVWGDDYGYTGMTNGEVHVDLGFSADGEAVAIARAEGDIVSQMAFGPQIKDISYGYARDWEELVNSESPSEYKVANTNEWQPIVGGVGFSSTPGSFNCTLYRLNVGIGNIDAAESYILDRSRWARDPVTRTYKTISFQDQSGTSYAAVPFPGFSSTNDGVDNFVLVAEGVIYIPSPGMWTFAAGTDDGFRCVISGHGQNFPFEYSTARGYGQTLATFNFPVAGAYSVKYTMYDQGGGSAADFSVAQGFKENWDSTFKLVGTSESGIVHAGALSAVLANDVSADMAGQTRLDWRTTFDFDGELGPDDGLELRIRYADGFVATLNGVEIARDNVPDGELATNSIALSTRAVTLALSDESFSVPVSLLRSTGNELVVTGLRRSKNSNDFFLAPTLVHILSEDRGYYFHNPTPGEKNNDDGYTEMTPAITFSEPHGYKTQPFLLALSCEGDSGAAIYYTLDGTSPNAATSTRYTAPIPISATTVVRAAVPDARSILQVDSTATYLFLDDILVQDANTPEGFPDNGAVNGQAMRYGMIPEIVNGSDRDRVLRGFTNSICTLSIVADPDNLFSAQKGIYVNPGNDGKGWERQICVEQIDPVNGSANEFTSPAGIRIRGAYSRSTGVAKHSLRLFFRSEYGSGALKFPLFGDEGADSFEKVDLRCSQNYAFSQGSDSDTLIHELFSRDTQRDMDQPYNRTRYYNVFINGEYWGVYMTEERGDKDYAETYLGGDDDDWDVIKTTQPGYVTTASDGNMDAFSALRDIAENEGFGGVYSDNYYRVLGMNPDGTRNPSYPILVNATNLMDFMINVHFAVDNDSPAADGMANNMYGLRDRTENSTGFVWLRHDAEHSLRFGGGYNTDSLLRGTTGYHPEIFGELRAFNPAELHYRLLANDEYRAAFADRIQKHLFGEGALTAPKATARFQARMAEIDDAVVCELARWGNASWSRQNWINSCNACLDFINNRGRYLVQHYRDHGWFPSIDAPTASAYSGELDAETPFALSSGIQFYYTTDGTDPRAVDDSPSASATLASRESAEPITLVDKNSSWRFYDWGNAPANDSAGNAWTSVAFDDSAWGSGEGILGVAGSNGNTVRGPTHRYVNHGSSGTQVTTTYFRKTIDISAGSNAATVTRIVGDILVDDGYVLYLNGTEIDRFHMGAGAVGYDTFSNATVGSPEQNSYTQHTIDIPIGLLRDGENVLAVEVHQCHGTSTDIYWDCALATAADTVTAIVDIPPEPTRVLARSYNSTTHEWSALTDVTVSKESAEILADPADALRIAEIMSATADGDGDGSEYIVVTNLDAECAIDLSGIRITCAKHGESPKCDFTLPLNTRLEAGAAMTFAKADYWSGSKAKITNGKVDAKLYDATGAVIQTLYIDANWWNGSCDCTGASFVARDFGDTVTEQSQWRPSSTALPDYLRVCEVMSSTADGDGDGSEYIVLTNLNDGAKIDLSELRITCAKHGDPPKVDIALPLEASIGKGKALVLSKADWTTNGWNKITNGKVDIILTDIAGEVVQTLYIDASWWDKACDGTGASFIALDFGTEVTTDTQWKPSYLPPTNKTGLKSVKAAAADEAMRQWFVKLGSTTDGQDALSAFTGSVSALEICKLAGLMPTNGEIALRITGISVAADGSVTIDGAIEVDGESVETTAEGTVSLLRYETLEGTASEVELDSRDFPLTTTDEASSYRFFKLKIQ